MQPRKHFVIPDTQQKPGAPSDHMDWIAQAIVDYRPDVVVHLGDHYDLPSLNSHEEPGSAALEGKRFAEDIKAGREAFDRLCAPMDAEIRRTRNLKTPWKPRRIFCLGNHEARADRVADRSPKLIGTIGSDQCTTRDWERHEYLKIVDVDGILYSHFFQNSHSGRPIGGSIPNKIAKIGQSFVHGHVQGLDLGTKMMANGKTYWGIQAGSCYLHREDYRGAQGQRHFRGIVVLHEVEDGECCPMVISLDYLCRKYEGKRLMDYMARKYPYGDWSYLGLARDERGYRRAA